MTKLAVVAVLAIALTSCEINRHESGHVVLPTYKLLGCSSPSCPLLWASKPSAVDAVYPKQVIIDMDGASVRGMTALYDKSVSINEIRSSIDGRYGKWAFATNISSPVKLAGKTLAR